MTASRNSISREFLQMELPDELYAECAPEQDVSACEHVVFCHESQPCANQKPFGRGIGAVKNFNKNHTATNNLLRSSVPDAFPVVLAPSMHIFSQAFDYK
jgi:hypothetical protein